MATLGDVAPGLVLQRVDRDRVNPPGARGAGDEQVPAVEAARRAAGRRPPAGPAPRRCRRTRCRRTRGSAASPVRPRTSAICCCVGPVPDEVSALGAEALPGGERVGPARPQRGSSAARCPPWFRDPAPRRLESTNAHDAFEQHAADQQHRQAHDDDPADGPRRPRAHPAREQPGEPAIQLAEQPTDRDESDEDQCGHDRQHHLRVERLAGRVHQLADLQLPAQPEQVADATSRTAPRGEEDRPRARRGGRGGRSGKANRGAATPTPSRGVR